jgi:hypothetical protein
MRKLVSVSIAVAIATVPLASIAQAKRLRDNPNYGYCKSGTRVADVKNCKENGGKK